jgi:multiple sugar transport system ATP-binding protein
MANTASKRILGIRPSDIRLAKAGDRALAAKVHLVEPLGDVTIVSVEANGQTLRIVLPEQQAIGMSPGDPAPIVIDPGKIHVFEAGTGAAIR